MMSSGFSRRVVRRGSAGRFPLRRRQRTVEWEWIGFSFAGAPVSPTAGYFILIPAAEIDELGNPTLMRIRGECLAEQTTDVAGQGEILMYGIGVLPERSITGGVNLPRPYEEANWNGWVYHQGINLHTPAQHVVGHENMAAQRFVIDARGRRRIKETECLFLAIENVRTSGVGDVSTQESFRILLFGEGR